MNPPEMGDFVSTGDRYLSVAKMPVFSVKQAFQGVVSLKKVLFSYI